MGNAWIYIFFSYKKNIIGINGEFWIKSVDQIVVFFNVVTDLVSVLWLCKSLDFRKYIMKYLEAKGHHVCNLFLKSSEKNVCINGEGEKANTVRC